MEIVGQQRVKIGKYYYYYLCPRCGSDDKRLRSKHCKACRQEYEKTLRSNFEPRSKEQIIEFVNRINKRNGMACLSEICVELITLFYSHYQSMGILDQLKPSQQVEMMWKYLNELVSNWENGINIVPVLGNCNESTSYQRIQKNYRENNREKIRKYQKEYRDKKLGRYKEPE